MINNAIVFCLYRYHFSSSSMWYSIWAWSTQSHMFLGGSVKHCVRLKYTLGRFFSWLPWLSLETLKTNFSVPTDGQGSDPDNSSNGLMMSSNGKKNPRYWPFVAGNSPVTGEFLAQRPVARSFDVFLDLRPHKWLSKQWRRWWFETTSR